MARMRDFADEIVGKVVAGEFIVVELAKGDLSPVYDHDGHLMTFKTSEAAAKYAETHERRTGMKTQPRRVKDDRWREREESRMKREYTLLPWQDQPWWHELKDAWKDHYPHVSVEKDAFIAYTENEEKGTADIQTRIKPGRYLQQYFEEKKLLSPYVIRDLCTIFSMKFEDNRLLWADTPEEIEEVYTNGPNSCMSKSTKEFRSSCHPTRAYAAGDIKVAYIRRDGRIVARTITFPEKGVYSPHIYGDKGRLEPLLRDQKLKPGLPHGARLLKIPMPDGKLIRYVAPFIDGVGWVRVDGDFLRVGSAKKDDYALNVESASGLTEATGHSCACCDRADLKTSMLRSIRGPKGAQMWCMTCVDDKAQQCAFSGDLCPRDQMLQIWQGRPPVQVWVSKQYEKTHTFKCAGSGEMYNRGDAVELRDRRLVSHSWWRKNGGYCHNCGACHFDREATCCGNKVRKP